MPISKFSKNIKLFLLGAFILLVTTAVFVVGSIIYDNKNDDSGTNQEYEETQEQIIETINSLNDGLNNYINNESEEIINLANNVKTTADIERIDEDKQGLVSIAVINKLVNENSIDSAQQYIDFAMKREDGFALEASKLCFQTSQDEDRRTLCRERANVLARNQGIIEDSEELPLSYLEKNENEQG